MSKNDQTKDSIQDAMMSNLCGPCRAMGNPPPCKGHGGGGGDSGTSGSKSENKKNSNDNLDAKERLKQIDIINSLVLDGNFWTQLPWLDNALKYEKPEALLSIQIDHEHGMLTMQGKRDLTKEEEKILQQFFASIKTELEKFKEKLSAEDIATNNFKIDINDKNNSLTIKMPPNYFLAFIMQLIENNLLPTKAMLHPEKKDQIEHKETTVEIKRKNIQSIPFFNHSKA